MSVITTIGQLADPASEFKPALLSRLSGLLPPEQQELQDGWHDIPLERRLKIVDSVVGMAEDDIEVDFLFLLLNALQDDEATVRAAAATGLWETGDRVAITPLVALLEADDFEEVRAAAAAALGHFVDLAEAGKLIQRDTSRLRDALLRSLEDEDEELLVRRRSLEAIASSKTPGIEDWVRWAYHSSDPGLRRSAVFAMGRTGDSSWLSIIIEEMESSSPAMRFEAANSARELADSEALPYLHDLVDDGDTEVALAAVHAIGGIGGPSARKLLKRYSEREEGSVSEAASEALGILEADESDFSMLDVEER